MKRHARPFTIRPHINWDFFWGAMAFLGFLFFLVLLFTGNPS